MKIKKIYVINLADKYHRWYKFKNLDKRFERFRAIDSRTDPSVYKNKNLSLNPVGLASQLYFSQAPGAIGAYLSHFSIWEDIIKNNTDCAMILEDDAKLSDVKSFLQEEPTFDESADFFQLNKRWHPVQYYNNFDGFESYIVTQRGAKIMKDATYNRDHFNGLIRFTPSTMGSASGHKDMELFKNEPNQDWSVKNSISCPVDKLAGFCAHPGLPTDKKLRIKFLRKIGLFEQLKTSDILKDGVKEWNYCTEDELNEFMSTEQFQYWKS